MNKFIYYILILTVFFVACTSNTIINKPENLIPKEQMVDLLTDLFIAMNAQNTKNIDLKRNVDYFPLVFEKYKIDSTQFKESNYYYTSKVDDYDEILNEVQKRLEKLNEFYNKEKKHQIVNVLHIFLQHKIEMQYQISRVSSRFEYHRENQ